MDNVPSGVIWLYFAKQGQIPVGWHECDGTNGTPNMVGRYPIGTNDFATVGEVIDSKHTHKIDIRVDQNSIGYVPGGGAVPGLESQGDDLVFHTHKIQVIGETSAEQPLPPSVRLIYIMKL